MELDYRIGLKNTFMADVGRTSMAEGIWKELSPIINLSIKGMKDFLIINFGVCEFHDLMATLKSFIIKKMLKIRRQRAQRAKK